MILFILSFCFFHPLHVSVTEIKVDSKDKELEITARFFIDDLEEAIRQERKQASLDVLNPGEGLTTDLLVSSYLAKHLYIKVDGKVVLIKYLGYEIDGDALIVYAYSPNVKKLKSIVVYHSTITELYDDQSNLVHVTLGEKTRSLRLMRGSPEGSIVFNE